MQTKMTQKTIPERLGLGNETRELKLGHTFTSHRDSSNAFHTIRYDFKPVSVDSTKPAILEIGENNKVTVTAPNVEGSGAPETIFKGSRKPHQKECVLVINHETGEITLERLNQNIIVKKTRDGYTSKAQQLSQRPNTPVLETRKPVPPPPQAPVSKQKPNSSSNTSAKNSQNLPKNNKHNNSNKLSPPKSNGHQNNSQKRLSPGPGHGHGHGHGQPISPSMPTLSALSNMPPSNSNSNLSSSTKRDSDLLGLSESSSDSSDQESSSSSSSDDDDDDDHNQVASASVNAKLKVQQNKCRSKSSSSSSESDFEEVPSAASSSNNHFKHNGTISNGTNGVNPYTSMPKFSQLSEDLRLSESGSDSD